jgi:hypothetical protein
MWCGRRETKREDRELSGKGSGRRPQQVTEDEAAANWARIFGNNTPPEGEQPEQKESENGE